MMLSIRSFAFFKKRKFNKFMFRKWGTPAVAKMWPISFNTRHDIAISRVNGVWCVVPAWLCYWAFSIWGLLFILRRPSLQLLLYSNATIALLEAVEGFDRIHWTVVFFHVRVSTQEWYGGAPACAPQVGRLLWKGRERGRL